MRLRFFRHRLPLPPDASAWVARMHARRLRGRERRALREWLAASPAHARELLRVEAAWRLSGALARAPEVQSELSLLLRSGDAETAFAPVARRGVMLRWAAMGTLSVLALALVWHAFEAAPTSYRTAVGEQRMITLDDGSVVAVNTGSRLAIEYEPGERHVELEGGEALFEVSPDPSRPFTVSAGAGWARAVGTRFNVLMDTQSVTVTVLEGTVEVAPNAANPRLRTRVQTGQSVAFSPSGVLVGALPQRASLDRIVAWREGKLRFDAWSLEQAVAEHNRYARKPIRIDGSVPADVRVSGVFRIGDTQAFLGALHELMALQVVDEGEYLSLSPQPSAHVRPVEQAAKPVVP
jgi:transmembrane sensor